VPNTRSREPQDSAETIPRPKVTLLPEYTVPLLGSDAIRAEYLRKGTTTWLPAAFLTRLPGEFAITPHTAGEPESGSLRFRLIKDNKPYDQFSTIYPVALS